MCNHGFHIDIVLPGLIIILTMASQHPSDAAGQIAVSRVPATNWLTLPQVLPKAPIVSLQLLQPPQEPPPPDASERSPGLLLAVRSNGEGNEGEESCGQIGRALVAILARKAVGWAAAEAAVRVLQAENPGTDLGAVSGAEGD